MNRCFCDSCEQPLEPGDAHRTSTAFPLAELDIIQDKYTLVVGLAIVPREGRDVGVLSGFSPVPGAPMLELCKDCVLKYLKRAVIKFGNPVLEVSRGDEVYDA